MSSILDKIVEKKRQELAELQSQTPISELEKRLAEAPPTRGFRNALMQNKGVAIIAEVKKASPSAGIIREDFDPVQIAQIYEQHGASCISVLTDKPFFQGDLQYLKAVRDSVSIPCLRKDFILDRYQIIEARLAGADAVLLIAEILDEATLPMLLREIEALGMDALVELYDAENLQRVLDSGATLVGINNRNLRTFDTSLEHTLTLSEHMPNNVCLVSESGIRTFADIQRLEQGGAKAVLVGETLMRAEDIGGKLQSLLSST